MTDRERFVATMHYKPVDRGFIADFWFWEETIAIWQEQGHLPNPLPPGGTDEWFGMDNYGVGAGLSVGLRPGFEWKIIEDRGDHEVIQDWEGVITLRKKFLGSIPIHLGHTLVDRESWEKEFIPKLDPDDPARFPEDWAAKVAWTQDPTRDKAAMAPGFSLFGWLRNWMGVDNVAMLVYDEPDLFEEILERITVISETVLTKAFADGAKFECCGMWEDMCYSGGPLLSPGHFKQYMVPRYRRVADILRKNGCDVIWVDCDGSIDQLIPMWLEAGINTMFPIEVGTWHADPVKMRKEYGKDLLLMGGFDKHILAESKEAIEREVLRLAPLVEEGGFIPMPDHRVPPDVPYEHHLHWLRTIRKVWGKDCNLKPSPALEV